MKDPPDSAGVMICLYVVCALKCVLASVCVCETRRGPPGELHLFLVSFELGTECKGGLMDTEGCGTTIYEPKDPFSA